MKEADRHLQEGELELVRELAAAWWTARKGRTAAVLGVLEIPGEPHGHVVEWMPHRGIVCRSISKSDGWVSIIEGLPPNTTFSRGLKWKP